MTAFLKGAVKDDNNEKLIYFSRKLTAKEVYGEVDKIADFLIRKGVQKGESVMIVLPNIVQGVTSVYGINAAGAVANVCHPKIGTDGLIKIAKKTNTKWVFLFDRFYAIHREELKKNGLNVILCRMSTHMNNLLFRLTEPCIRSQKGVYEYAKVVAPREEALLSREKEGKGEDPAVYLHSSGTTGESKTVVLSNRAMNELAANIHTTVNDAIGLSEKDSMLMTLPLFHGFGLGVCVHLMMYFGKIVLEPVFNAKKTVKFLRKNEISFMCVVPNMLRRLIREPGFDDKHLHHLRQIFVGGDKLDEKLLKESMEIMHKNGSSCRISEGFGLSETASVTHINMDCKEGGTVGRPIANVKAKIMGKNGEMPVGEEGIIYICSPSLMSGYLGNGATVITDEEGNKWLNTGDIGYVDEEGFLYYKGRQKRMLKVGGVNIFPQEVESVAESLPEVKNACAVRVKWNGKPALKLLVVLHEGKELDVILKRRLENSIKSNILPYAIPKYIEKVDELKMTGMGKTDYRFYEEEAAKQKDNKKNTRR